METVFFGGFMEDKSNKEKEKKGLIYAFENFSFKKAFKYNFWILIVFFIFIGIFSIFVLSDQAYKLVGGKRYNELISGSGGKISFSIFEKVKYIFSNEYEKEKMIAEKLNESGIDVFGESENSDFENKGDVSSNYNIANYGDLQKKGLTGSGIPYRPNRNISSSLNPPDTYLSGSHSNTSASINTQSSSISAFSTSKSGVAKIKTMDTKFSLSKPTGRNSNNSALDLLKNTYKTTLQAARDASNDTARAWTAKAFDLAGDIKTTLEYDEKLRTKLDKINPNAIPAFLKDPSLDASSLRTLGEADVPSLSKEDKEKGMEINFDFNNKFSEEEEEESNNLTKNFINPLLNFGGNTRNNSEDEALSIDPKDPTKATDKEGNVIELPSSQPNLGSSTPKVTTDEYGYIRVDNGDVIQIFDPNSGKILGCEMPNEGMCVLPGANQQCPSDLYFV